MITFKNKVFKPFAIARDNRPADFNADPINTKIKEFWAKIRGVLGTVGVLGLLVVILRWAGVTTSVDGIQELLGAADAFVDAIVLVISALALVVERASEAFKDE